MIKYSSLFVIEADRWNQRLKWIAPFDIRCIVIDLGGELLLQSPVVLLPLSSTSSSFKCACESMCWILICFPFCSSDSPLHSQPLLIVFPPVPLWDRLLFRSLLIATMLILNTAPGHRGLEDYCRLVHCMEAWTKTKFTEWPLSSFLQLN